MAREKKERESGAAKKKFKPTERASRRANLEGEKEKSKVEPGRCCSPHHELQFCLSFLDFNCIL